MAIDTEPGTSGAPEAPPGTPPQQIVMRLWRGDASGGRFEDYRVEPQEGEVVLDVVHRIQATQAPDLAVRWNCKAGKCGSCSAEVNGRPVLMCMTRMSTLPIDKPITISPMRGFPTMRDLVTDVSYNFEVAKLIPAFKPRPRDPDGLYRMAQIDIDRGQEFHKCIECFLCQNVCHVIRDHEDNKPKYAGPRFFVRLAELEMHPLDTLDRRDYIRREMGLGLCNITKCCTEVCPEDIHITDNAIIPLKERVVDAHYDPLAWIGRKLTRRPIPLRAAQAWEYTGAAHAQPAAAGGTGAAHAQPAAAGGTGAPEDDPGSAAPERGSAPPEPGSAPPEPGSGA